MVDVEHHPERTRFTVTVDSTTGFLTYEVHDGTVAMTHTIVPPEIGGRGIAGELTRTAVAWAREQQLSIDAQCSYVRHWLTKHPDA